MFFSSLPRYMDAGQRLVTGSLVFLTLVASFEFVKSLSDYSERTRNNREAKLSALEEAGLIVRGEDGSARPTLPEERQKMGVKEQKMQ